MPPGLRRTGQLPRAPGPGPGWTAGAREILLALALLALYLASQYAYALNSPFVGDDYVFLEKMGHAGFRSVWEPRALLCHYYRPWSRELHYWVLLRLFGAQQLPFHLASMVLALGTGGLYWALARRIASATTGAMATAAVFALAAWGVLLVWAAGCQDLWMLIFALGTLLAVSHRRSGLALVLQTLALLSKETSAVVPGIAFAYVFWIEGRGPGEAARRTAALAALTGVWAAFHPLLGGRLLHPFHEATIPGLHQPLARLLGRTVLSLVNLDELPRPLSGWGAAATSGIVAAALLAGLVALGALRGQAKVATAAPPAAPAWRVAAFGATWAALAWVPLLMPSLGWHAYYAMLGILGAWLALAVLIASRPALAVAVVVALALLRSARTDTLSADWGTEWFQRRAQWFGAHTRDWLLARYPAMPPHSRVYVATLPGNVGLVPGGEESPALRVWYGDPTLRTFFLSRYTPRAAAAPGCDYFFFWDSLAGWREVTAGPEPSSPGLQADPFWRRDHVALALVMTNTRDWRGAAVEWEKLAVAFPERPDYPYDLAVCLEQLGDSATAARWYSSAAERPRATEQILAAARRTRSLLAR